MINKDKKQLLRNGFTLMEAMMTVAIIAIMSAVYLVNYRPTNQKILLDQAAAGIVADLRNAQNMAMNVKKFEGAIPRGGYGIFIDIPSSDTKYVIFADCNINSHIYDNSADCGPGLDKEEKVIERALPQNIKIASFKDSSNNNINNTAFQPPNPIVWIDGADTAALATITLQYAGTTTNRTITINRFTGQISVSN